MKIRSGIIPIPCYSKLLWRGMQMLRGEKVVLRPVKRSDINHFLKWFNDPEVIQ
jgi:hypothetical protein